MKHLKINNVIAVYPKEDMNFFAIHQVVVEVYNSKPQMLTHGGTGIKVTKVILSHSLATVNVFTKFQSI